MIYAEMLECEKIVAVLDLLGRKKIKVYNCTYIFFASKRKYICNYMPGILFSDWTICILVMGVLTILLLL